MPTATPIKLATVAAFKSRSPSSIVMFPHFHAPNCASEVILISPSVLLTCTDLAESVHVTQAASPWDRLHLSSVLSTCTRTANERARLMVMRAGALEGDAWSTRSYVWSGSSPWSSRKALGDRCAYLIVIEMLA